MPELYPEDQEKVNAYLQSGTHDIERKPFRPLFLLLILLLILAGLSAIAFVIASFHGIV